MKKIILITIALVFLLGACSSSISTDTDTNAESHTATLEKQTIQSLDEPFAQAINNFGFRTAEMLYDTKENLALSPVSIELALAMTRAGASGDTAKEMASALCLDNMSDEEIISACKSLMWRANTGGMEAANSIWLSKDYTFSENFVDTCTNDFMADAMPLIIPGAKDEINAWVKEKTHEKIDSILTDELDPLTEIVLCNALYYLGDWEIPFEANDTFDQDFATPNGTIATAFMHSDWDVPYYENDAFSMISLNFKSEADEGKYAMAFMLPKEGTNINNMLSSMGDNAFSDALNALEQQEVWIKLPKFEYTFFTPLIEPLKDLGMKQAFSGDADFSAMTDAPNGLYIAEVLHKCYIRIDELGAEAAAVTEVACEDVCEELEEPATFYADRPFMFAIYSLEDGTVAFMGAVNDPSKE